MPKEEEQTTQWLKKKNRQHNDQKKKNRQHNPKRRRTDNTMPKEKGGKDKQQSTKHIHKITYRVILTPKKEG